MASYQNDYSEQYKAEAVGNNWRTLFTWIAVLAIGSALLAGAYWYGYVIFPRDVVLQDDTMVEPLVEEIPLDVMPELPDELATAYDNLDQGQRDELNTYEFVDEGAGIVRIPLEDAIDMIEEEGLPTRDGQ